MQEERQEKEPEIPEEDGAVEETDEPSSDEEQPVEESEQITPDEEESESTDEDEDEPLLGEVEDDDLFAEGPSRRRGCLMGCVMPIIIIFTVALVIGLIGYSKRDAIQQSLLRRTVTNTQNQVLNEIELAIEEGRVNDIPDMGSAQIEKAFKEILLALKDDRIKQEALTEAIEEFQEAIGEQKKQAIDNLMTDLSATIARPAR